MIFIFQYNGNNEEPESWEEALKRMGTVVIDADDGTEWKEIARIAGVESVSEISKVMSSEGIPYRNAQEKKEALDEARKRFPTATFA